jgi:hypothetical protein
MIKSVQKYLDGEAISSGQKLYANIAQKLLGKRINVLCVALACILTDLEIEEKGATKKILNMQKLLLTDYKRRDEMKKS